MDNPIFWIALIGVIFFTVRWAMYGPGGKPPRQEKRRPDDEED